MTFRASNIDSTAPGGNVTEATVVVPATVQPGDTLTIAVQRGSSSSTPMFAASSNGGTLRRQIGTDEACLLSGSGTGFSQWQRTAVAGDAGSTITISTAGASNEWLVGVHAEYDVGPIEDVAVVSNPSGGGTTFNLPAANPAIGSSGGRAVHFVLGYVNNNNLGLTYTSTDATIREQFTRTRSSGISLAMGIMDRTFTGDTQVPQGQCSSSPSATGRAAITVLYSGEVTNPLTVAVDDVDSVTGGQALALTATPAGGTGPYTAEWEQIGGTGLVFDDPTSLTPNVTVPIGGGTFEVGVVITDDVAGTAADSIIFTAAPRVSIGLNASTLGSGVTASNGATNPTTVVDRLDGTTPYLILNDGAVQDFPLGALPGSVRNAGAVFYLPFVLEAGTGTLTCQLREGSTVRGTVAQAVSTTRERETFAFTAGQCAAIGDLGNCTLRVSLDIA